MKSSYILAIAVYAVLALNTYPLSAQQNTASVSAALTAIEKVKALPTTEQRNEKTTQYTIPVESLTSVAPEFIQKRTEILPSPHARMPHMTTQKTVEGVDYATMVPLLVKAIQEQQTEIERLRNELTLIKAQARK